MEKKVEIQELKTIFDAIKEGNLDEVRALVKNNKNLVNEKNADGFSPLFFANMQNMGDDKKDNRFEIIKFLVESGAELNFQDSNGYTALHLAVLYSVENDLRLIKYLLDKGARRDIKNNNKYTPLAVALLYGFDTLALELMDESNFNKLLASIKAMEDYGYALTKINASKEVKANEKKDSEKEDAKKEEVKSVDSAKTKGEVVIALAEKLRTKVNEFAITSLKKEPTEDQKNKFKEEFDLILNSQNDAMKKHRAVWKPIIANILIASTLIGAIAIAIRAIATAIKNNKSNVEKKDILKGSFFYAQTNSETKVNVVKEEVEEYITSLGQKK